MHSTRRQILLGALGGVAASAWATRAHADDADTSGRWLDLTHVHTGESLHLPFRDASGAAIPESLVALRRLLRDFRAAEEHDIDVALYDQLHDLALAAGADAHYEIICGYRSPATNEMLRERGRGVAAHSMHLSGQALDVRLLGVRCESLGAIALAQARGGVGIYRGSDFVHIDTGRVRSWTD